MTLWPGCISDAGYEPANVFRTVFPSWDNTPRTGARSLIILNGTPENYEYWLSEAIQKTAEDFPAEERFVFVNAWNEWAEGCHLEPDDAYGRRFLEATLRAKTGASSGTGFADVGLPNRRVRSLAIDTKEVFQYHLGMLSNRVRSSLNRFPRLKGNLRRVVQLLKGTGDHHFITVMRKGKGFARDLKELPDVGEGKWEVMQWLRKRLRSVPPFKQLHIARNDLQKTRNDLQRVRNEYLSLMEACLAGTIYEDLPLTVLGQTEFDRELREYGWDWPSKAHTMIGARRLANLRALTENVILNQIPGDLMETGVWRGGACILIRRDS